MHFNTLQNKSFAFNKKLVNDEKFCFQHIFNTYTSELERQTDEQTHVYNGPSKSKAGQGLIKIKSRV